MRVGKDSTRRGGKEREENGRKVQDGMGRVRNERTENSPMEEDGMGMEENGRLCPKLHGRMERDLMK